MVDLKEKIGNLCPSATFEDGEVLRVCVDAKEWRALAEQLKNDADLNFDYLVAVIGCDWKETLGCVYELTSTASRAMLEVKVTTTDRENPMLHSVSDFRSVKCLTSTASSLSDTLICADSSSATTGWVIHFVKTMTLTPK